MKKSVLTILMVLAMLAMFVGPVAAAPLSTGTANLESVKYIPAVGPVFIFSVTGEFSKEDLNGSLRVEGGEEFGLYCNWVDSSTIRCISSKKVSGKNVTLAWGGIKFSAFVPVAPEFCYDVYDWSLDASNTWVNYGSYCQEKPANYGDFVEWFNADWGGTYQYEFLPESPTDPFCVLSPASGDAYYYPSCPVGGPI